jgi:hypothetical protein
MRFAFRKLPLLVLGLAVMASAQSASAGYYSETVNYTGGVPPFTDTLSFAKFNTAYGTLTGVTIELVESATIQSTVVNLGPILTPSTPSNSWANAQTSATVSVLGPDGSTTSTMLASTPFSGTSSVLVNMGPVFNGNTSNTTSAATLSDYEGSGTGTFTVMASGSALHSSGDSTSPYISFGGTATVTGSVVITFTYNGSGPPSVPEPASLGMVVLGLGGFYAVRRIRRKVA